jgi:hypothetical protein
MAASTAMTTITTRSSTIVKAEEVLLRGWVCSCFVFGLFIISFNPLSFV